MKIIKTLAATSVAVVSFLASSASAYADDTADSALTGWRLTETRSKGHNELEVDGLHVYTEDISSESKAAAYKTVTGLTLGNLGAPAHDWACTGSSPGLQLIIATPTNGWGLLVGEDVYGGDWWLTGSSSDYFKGLAPIIGGGSGSQWHGTLAQWTTTLGTSHPISEVGYSLGSGAQGDCMIDSLTFGSEAFTFGLVEAPTNLRAIERTASSISLAWDASSDPDVIGYNVHRVGGGTAPRITTTHKSGSLQPDTDYTFTVTPVTINGSLGDPATLTVSTLNTVNTPVASRVSETRNSITLKWTQTPGATHWYISRVGGGSGVLKTVREHTSGSLQPDTVYTFRIRAAAGSGTNEIVSAAETIQIRTKP